MKKVKILAAALLLWAVQALPAAAETWYIQPDGMGDAPTIQAGLDACSAGDIVLVAAGTYYENITWPTASKPKQDRNSIVLMSESGAEVTIIDGGGNGSVITIATAVDNTTRISGFTIQNGQALQRGGGIHCLNGASPTIMDNVISGNDGGIMGGGIACADGSSPTIDGNTITNNTLTVYADIDGGGGIVCIYGSSPIITNNTITNNTSPEDNSGGGGIFVNYDCSPTISRNLITGNNAGLAGGGLSWLHSCFPTVSENTIANNSSVGGGGIYSGWESGGTITGNTITENQATLGGGGITSQSSTVTIHDNIITENTCLQRGGGIACGYQDTTTITGNRIANNSAPQGAGLYFHVNSQAIIEDCEIEYNLGHGAYILESSNPVFHRNVFWDNDGYGVINLDPTVTIDAENNCWGDPNGPGGEGPGSGDEVWLNVDYDPWLLCIVGVEAATGPELSGLLQNFPNPFNPSTKISFAVSGIRPVRLEIFSVDGRLVKELVAGELSAGIHEVSWAGRDEQGRPIPSSVYFYRLETGNYVETKRMTLLK